MTITQEAKASMFARIEGRDSWCVPTGLSALTGHSTEVIRALVLGHSMCKQWEGVTFYPIREAIRSLGIRIGTVRDYRSQMQADRPVFGSWMQQSGCSRNGLYVLSAGSHLMIYRDSYVVDNGFYAAKRPMSAYYMRAGLKAPMDWTIKLENRHYHLEMDWHQPPEWAEDLATALTAARVLNGTNARIPESEAKRLAGIVNWK